MLISIFRLGIATAPVLFAAERFPEMEVLISRRFSKEGDVEKAFEMVLKSDGMEETKVLAKKYADAAVHSIKMLKESESKQGLYKLLDAVIDRMNWIDNVGKYCELNIRLIKKEKYTDKYRNHCA